jgi:DNA-binding HxlR family transcriptional regulator
VATRSRGYGQYCGLARALELVGERWALLIVRDLLVGPRRFTDLRQGLPRIPSNVLADRLKELERDGIVQRRVLPRPASSVVYELTDYGAQLEDALMRLGVWGAQRLGETRPGEIITPDSMVIALRSTFVPSSARNAQYTFELRLGPVIVHANVDNGRITAAEGHADNPDLVITGGPAVKDLLTGDVTPDVAIKTGLVQLEGNPELLEKFVRLFHIPSHTRERASA